MRVVSRVRDGLFIEDVLLEDDAPLPEGCIESRPPEGFHSPRWDGAAWVEAKPSTELLEERRQTKIAEIRSRVVFEANAIMSVWEFIYITRIRVTDPRTTTLEGIARKGRDLEAWAKAATTVAEIESITWDELPATFESFPEPPSFAGPRKPGEKK